uniref:C-type lectin domain family 2 member D-like n=1 Tax=Euleptes europaea TaxID=460621 RepID=UPI002541BBEB|nr:C-type lectin domain family 2 member D-like [Euleptes europaea]
MRSETREVRRPGRAEAREDPILYILQDDKEVIKERAKHKSCQNYHHNSSPCGVLPLVITAILVLIIIVLLFFPVCGSLFKECLSLRSDVDVPAPCGPACPSGWIGYEGKCYFFSDGVKDWTAGHSFCASYGSSLAVIESEPEKAFLMRYMCSTDHWIGLRKDPGQTWKWADGTELNGTLVVRGEGGDCAFLNSVFAISSRCYIQRNWICSHHDAYARNKSSSIRR